MPKVSVIIPVYNTEKYLRKCLESVINQTLKDIEIICINDCSTDDSPNILNDIKDERLKILNLPKNSGVSFARNRGIDEAKGEYISFVDSDDFIAPDFLEKLYNKSQGADAVKGNIYLYDNLTDTAELTDFYNMNDKIRENYSYFYYGFTGAIYKREFIEKFNIRFPEGVNYFEDTYFSIKSAINYRNISFDESAKYFYVKRAGSLSSEHLNKLKYLKNIVFDIISLLNDTDRNTYEVIYNFLFRFVEDNYYNISLDSETKETLFDILLKMYLDYKYDLKITDRLYTKITEEFAEGHNLDTLLKYYKNYDYLNENKTVIKILVSYIKPSFLFKSEILTPIHLGRVVEKEISKDGKISDDEISWLHQNCIGDENFDGNISSLNRRLGFFTGTYWAWKNYDKLGNPEYFGSFGYRRLLLPNCLNEITDYDLILPRQKKFNETIKEQMINCHGKIFFDSMINVINHTYPEELSDITEYFNRTQGYFAELYIMKKCLFFEYCDWIYKIINCFLGLYPNRLSVDIKEIKNLDIILAKFLEEDAVYSNNETRDIAYIVERLTGYYLYKLTKRYKYKETGVLEAYISFMNYSIENYKRKMLKKMREKVVNSMKKSELNK